MRSLAIYCHKKRVRGMRRRMRALARWADAFSGPFPAGPTVEDRYWNFKIPVLDSMVEGPRARRKTRAQCAQHLIDAATNLMRAKPASATSFRVTASICVPDLFGSEVCIYTDEAYFQSKVQPSEDVKGSITPITGRSLVEEWGLVLPPGVVERGVLWDFREGSDPSDGYRSELWFYGEWAEGEHTRRHWWPGDVGQRQPRHHGQRGYHGRKEPPMSARRDPVQGAENPNAFKHWFNQAAVARLADSLLKQHPAFDHVGFLSALAHLETLELKDRVRAITAALQPSLNLPFPDAVSILVSTLGPPTDPSVPNQFQFILWPLVHYVGVYGQPYFDASMAALHAFTQRFSAEFDIRPFLIGDTVLTLAVLQRWTTDPSEHVRRLVSEGTRPRLPWGERLPAFIRDPSPVLPLLEALKDDTSAYVRKSVGNNLNDIAKDHPSVVIATCRRWLDEADTPARRGIVKLALRTLVKQGDSEALVMMGHGGAEDLSVEGLVGPAQVSIGDTLTFRFNLHNYGQSPVSAQVDYLVHHVGARGSRSAKVFKLKAVSLPAGGDVAIEKRHSLRPVTVRALYPGKHRIEVQANGTILAGFDFELLG